MKGEGQQAQRQGTHFPASERFIIFLPGNLECNDKSRNFAAEYVSISHKMDEGIIVKLYAL